MPGGFLFRFGHALALEFANGSPKITVTGVPGYSTDLATWSVAEMFVCLPMAPFSSPERTHLTLPLIACERSDSPRPKLQLSGCLLLDHALTFIS